MKAHLITSIRMTIVTTVLLGLLYPAITTGLAQLLFHDKANGQLIQADGKTIGSSLIGQPFVSDAYFHSRPSAAGSIGYDAAASSGSNLGPTNQKLVSRVQSASDPSRLMPIDLVTSSASGLDPHISPAAAFAQVARVSAARGFDEQRVHSIVERFIVDRQLGILGEKRVNVLELNMNLDTIAGTKE